LNGRLEWIGLNMMNGEQGSTVAVSADDEPLRIGDKTFRSRLMLGTGKYRSAEEMNAALEQSGCEIVTVALRRIDLDQPKRSILDEIDWKRYAILPNTAGARTADEAVRTARMAKAMGLSDMIKVEVIPDPKYLLPDPVGTLEACTILVKEGFTVLPYINADPVLALRLQDIGCATVMPLASPIGSGQGMKTFDAIKIIVEQARVPVVVDAGIGVPSDAALSMELGASACLINTAVAKANNPALMATAMRLAIEAGRAAFLAGRMPVLPYASASSPVEGVVRA
jgi:thiazole synthase